MDKREFDWTKTDLAGILKHAAGKEVIEKLGRMYVSAAERNDWYTVLVLSDDTVITACSKWEYGYYDSTNAEDPEFFIGRPK
jgi:hypothetical protein